MILIPITIKDAKVFVAEHHRHHPAPQKSRFAVACGSDDAVLGVAIVGDPVARMLDDGWTAEVTRVCVLPDAKNACSMLYGAAWRAARALGYRKLITYTLATEPGTSLHAAGWKCIGEAGGGSWNRKNRPRVDHHPTQLKMRWEAAV